MGLFTPLRYSCCVFLKSHACCIFGAVLKTSLKTQLPFELNEKLQQNCGKNAPQFCIFGAFFSHMSIFRRCSNPKTHMKHIRIDFATEQRERAPTRAAIWLWNQGGSHILLYADMAGISHQSVALGVAQW